MKIIDWNIKEFVASLTEVKREFDIGDNVAIFYKESYLPIKINELVEPKLKYFKSSFCIYDIYEEGKTAYEYDLDIEMIAIEEFSDSPNSIYIDVKGNVETNGITNINSIQLSKYLYQCKY